MRTLLLALVLGLAACGTAASQVPVPSSAATTTQVAPVCCNAQGGVGTTPYGPPYTPTTNGAQP